MRALVVDDHPVFLGALQTILETHFEKMEFTGLRSVDEVQALGSPIDDYNLVIIDLSYRGDDATRHVCSLIKENPGAKFLVLTNFEDGRHIRAVSEAGARGYLPKSSSAEILTSVVQLIAAGGHYFPVDESNQASDPFLQSIDSKGGTVALLSQRQKKIFEQLAAGATIAEIADGLRVSEPTIKADIAKATKSLGGRNRLHAVCLAIEMGLVRPDLN